MHISSKFCLDRDGPYGACTKFGSSLTEFRRRVHDHPDRIKNLYFVYLLMLRAVIKAGPLIAKYDFDAGDAVEQDLVKRLLQDLVHPTTKATLPGTGHLASPNAGRERDGLPCLRETPTAPFDESVLFAGERRTMLSTFR